MIKQLLLLLVVFGSYCVVFAQDSILSSNQFVGKWMFVDYKVDGVTDADALAEIDSTTYWLQSNGNVTFSMRRIPGDSDSVYVDGTWKYVSRSNELVINWKKGLAADVKSEVLQLDPNTLVIKNTFIDGRRRVVMEHHFRKVL